MSEGRICIYSISEVPNNFPTLGAVVDVWSHIISLKAY